jgi:hypothetical protein
MTICADKSYDANLQTAESLDNDNSYDVHTSSREFHFLDNHPSTVPNENIVISEESLPLVSTHDNEVASPPSPGQASAATADIDSQTPTLDKSPVRGGGTYLNSVKRAFLPVPRLDDVQTGVRGIQNGIEEFFGLRARHRSNILQIGVSVVLPAPVSSSNGATIIIISTIVFSSSGGSSSTLGLIGYPALPPSTSGKASSATSSQMPSTSKTCYQFKRRFSPIRSWKHDICRTINHKIVLP